MRRAVRPGRAANDSRRYAQPGCTLRDVMTPENIHLLSLKRALGMPRLSTLIVEFGLLTWATLVVTLPLFMAQYADPEWMRSVYVEPFIHQLVESFCGIMALLIGSMLLRMSTTRYKSIVAVSPFFGTAFLVMGSFDLLHAFSDPHSSRDSFVFLHTLSALSGGVLIAFGSIRQILSLQPRQRIFDILTQVGAGLAVILAIGLIYGRVLSVTFTSVSHPEFSFSAYTHWAHIVSGVTYSLAALLLYFRLRVHNRLLAVIVFTVLILFAESAYLFRFSSMWDLTWWMWHVVKVLLYLSILIVIVIGFLYLLNAVEQSRLRLAASNTRLHKAQHTMRAVNQELEIRNRMAGEAMISLDFDHILDVISRATQQLLGTSRCELILSVNEEEVSEFQRMLTRRGCRWPVAVTAGSPCAGSPCTRLPVEGIDIYTCAVNPSAPPSFCLPLEVQGMKIGYLRLHGKINDSPDQYAIRMRSLAAEIGPIINNAMLYHRWHDENAFRMALLRVSFMLTSTLDLNELLRAVCRESERLLESDGAMVWLPGREGEEATLVSICGEHGETFDCRPYIKSLETAIREHGLLDGPDGRPLPRSILIPDAIFDPRATSDNSNCPWGSTALFPLTGDDHPMGIMALMRRERVLFGSLAMAKGILLADQVRNAIHNARSYRRLAEANERLRVAEESKRRGEQLAMLGQMAASVAHEVRNPLSAISNCLAVLRSAPGTQKAKITAMEIIEGEIERLNRLTRDFLTLGKSHQSPPKPILLGHTLSKMCTMLEQHLDHTKHRLTVRWGINGPSEPILIDSDGLETVLWNLLLNAAQAIEGSGEITVKGRQRADHILLVVQDTGKGIPHSERKKIFEPFYSSRSQGAGLGLAIVERFVRTWGGRIRVGGEPGRGTTMFLRIPAERTRTAQYA